MNLWSLGPNGPTLTAYSGGYAEYKEEKDNTNKRVSLAGGPFPKPAMPTRNVVVSKVPLPPGVANLEQWGKTLVEFGRSQTGKSYAEAAQDVGYCTWVLARKTPGAQLADFQNYLLAGGKPEFEPTREEGMHLVPGTTQVRKYKIEAVKRSETKDGFFGCPECGTNWKGEEPSCPQCGWHKGCPECGTTWHADQLACFRCGYTKRSPIGAGPPGSAIRQSTGEVTPRIGYW